MSTRSAIITKIDGRYHGIYCHSDGYLAGVGRTLLEHYSDPAKVAELLALGDLSTLGSVIGEKHDFDWTLTAYAGGDWSKVRDDPRYEMCKAYHRDRGEPLHAVAGSTWPVVGSLIGHDGYVYVFDHREKAWSVSEGGPLQPLSLVVPAAIAAEEA